MFRNMASKVGDKVSFVPQTLRAFYLMNIAEHLALAVPFLATACNQSPKDNVLMQSVGVASGPTTKTLQASTCQVVLQPLVAWRMDLNVASSIATIAIIIGITILLY